MYIPVVLLYAGANEIMLFIIVKNMGLQRMKKLEGINVLDITYYLPGPLLRCALRKKGRRSKWKRLRGDSAKTMDGGIVQQANNKGKKSLRMI